MRLNHTLGIETALEGAGDSFIKKYRLMKERLLNVEYEHWAAGFPEGNNHGKGHILRVLEYLDKLLGGQKALEHINPYELFLAMMSVLYHDIGLLRERKEHADISKALLEGDTNDAYIINNIDKEIIAASVVSHSSSKDIAQECNHFSQEEVVGNYKARPKVIAALVRLADELDEDYRRGDLILLKRLNLPDESQFFWLFCQRVRGVLPNPTSKRIDFNIAFEPQDSNHYGHVPGGKVRHFVTFCAEKLAKINQERVVVNRFLPPELQYTGIHIDVKPLRNHPTWTTPRTFVFNDQTTADMFLGSFPELLAQPARTTMSNILELMRHGTFDKADEELDRLASILVYLPIDLQIQIYYEKACIQSLRATALPVDSPEQKQALNQAVNYLVEWFKLGQNGAFEAIGRTANAEVHRMVNDSDFSLVCKECLEKLKESIPKSYWPNPSPKVTTSSCVPVGTLIDTPKGECSVENLRIGDVVLSLSLEGKIRILKSEIVAITTSRSTQCVHLNKNWLITLKQPVYTSTGWVEAGSLQKGDSVMDRSGSLVPISEVEYLKGYFEVFDLTTNEPYHNYVANGLLCHNKMSLWFIS